MRIHTLAPAGTNLSPHLERNRKGRDLVVGDVHGHFVTLRRALAELEVGEHDRVISLGDLVDRGPDSAEAKEWIVGNDPSARFDLVLRGNHEQMMLEGLTDNPRGEPIRISDTGPYAQWMANGGTWWFGRSEAEARAWIDAVRALPITARVETAWGPVGLVHASPVYPTWAELESKLQNDDRVHRDARKRALWSRVRHGWAQRYLGETGEEHLGPVEGVRAVVTGHTPIPEPAWHENVLGIDTGVHIDDRGYGRLTIARIDGEEIETFSFAR